MAIKALTYPFRPKSNASLLQGQCWGIPLSDGTYACGRVMQVRLRDRSGRPDRRMFLCGLLDWHSDELPTHDSIAGAGVFYQGLAHIGAINDYGTGILGVRSLESDGLEPRLFRDSYLGPHVWVLRGLEPLRPATPEDRDLPVLETFWSLDGPQARAEAKFIEGQDIRNRPPHPNPWDSPQEP